MKNEEIFNYKNRKYDVVAYDPSWPERFSIEAQIIKGIFGNNVEIEHVGSTSVPGMEGKACIDILVIIKNLEIVKNHISDMENNGFTYRGNFISDDALLFTRVKDNEIQTNVHFFLKGHPHIKEMIQLRNYLRGHQEEVSQYSALKKELYIKYPNDYAKYRKEKDEYMERLKIRVLKLYK